MRIYQTAICDDDLSAHAAIAQATADAFARCGAQAEIQCCDSAAALTQAMEGQHFDLILLDIEMPGEDGIALGERLLRQKDAPDIIYVSSREDRVFDAFRARPFGFVRKSRFLQDIGEVIASYVAARPEESSRYFTVRSHNHTVSLALDDILYFEGDRKNQLVYTVNAEEPVVVSLSMKQLEDDFSGRGFLRVHSGFLVNYRYIHRMSNEEITLTNGKKIPVSRRKIGQIKLQYMDLLQQDGNRIY